MVNVVKVVGRVLVAALFLMAGLMKASPKDFPGTVAHTADSLRSSGAVAAAAKVGIDILPLAPYMVAAAAVLEVATGASLLFGKYTEAAVAATAFMVPVSFIMHFPDPANQMAMIHFLKNMCILGAVLLLATDRRRAATEKAKAA